MTERKQDLAGVVSGLAARHLALHLIRYEASHSTLDETCPHALIDASCLRALQDEGPEWTRRGHQLRTVAADGDEGNLKAEGAKRITGPFEPPPDRPRGRHSGGGRKLAAIVLAHLAKCLRPPSSGNLLDQEADQLSQAAVGELDPFDFRRDAVDLRRAPCSRPAAATASLEGDGEKSGFHEPVETTAGDVAVRVEVNRSLGSGKWIAPAPRIQEDAPELRIAGGCEPVEGHATAIGHHG